MAGPVLLPYSSSVVQYDTRLVIANKDEKSCLFFFLGGGMAINGRLQVAYLLTSHSRLQGGTDAQRVLLAGWGAALPESNQLCLQ